VTVTDIKDITSFKWATVTDTDPLEIKLDGDSSPLALIPDSLIDPLELGVSDRVRVELSLRKCVIHGVSNGNGGAHAGEGRIYFGDTAPTGWMMAWGQSLLRSAQPRLFAKIGTRYGAADSTHFNLPDTRGRVLVGQDAAQVEFDTIGEKVGAKTHTLTQAEMPSHTHSVNSIGYAGGSGFPNSRFTVGFGATRNTLDDVVTEPTGSGAAHNNIQPSLVANYIIKL